MKKIVLILIAAVPFSFLYAEGAQDAPDDGGAHVTVLIGKPEISGALEECVAEYNRSQDLYTVEIIPLAGRNAYETMTMMYASANAPTIANLGQEVQKFHNRLADLSDQPWVERALTGTLDGYSIDGRLVGMPLTVEAFGLIYNEDTLEAAIGREFDPGSIRTRDELSGLFAEIAAGSTAPVHVSPMDWSLGAHLSNLFFTNVSGEAAERRAFLDSLKKGSVDLNKNETFNGWMDTVDLLLRNNESEKDPLAPQYEDGVLSLASGKAAFWFMGNWALPQLQEANPDAHYGFLPLPVSNDPDQPGAGKISIGVPSVWTVDAEQSTEAERSGAFDFLNWLVTDAEGQKFYVREFKFIPVFSGFEYSPVDSLSSSILSYLESGNSLEWMNNQYPADGWASMGASMQKYISGVIDRSGLETELETYWSNVKE